MSGDPVVPDDDSVRLPLDACLDVYALLYVIVEQVQDAFGLNEEFKPMWFFEQGHWWPGMPE